MESFLEPRSFPSSISENELRRSLFLTVGWRTKYGHDQDVTEETRIRDTCQMYLAKKRYQKYKRTIRASKIQSTWRRFNEKKTTLDKIASLGSSYLEKPQKIAWVRDKKLAAKKAAAAAKKARRAARKKAAAAAKKAHAEAGAAAVIETKDDGKGGGGSKVDSTAPPPQLEKEAPAQQETKGETKEVNQVTQEEEIAQRKKAKAARKKAKAARKKAVRAEKAQKRAKHTLVLAAACSERRKIICNDLSKKCTNDKQRAFTTLLSTFDFPIHLISSDLFNYPTLSLISDIENKRYKKEELQATLANDGGLSTDFFACAHTCITDRLNRLSCPRRTNKEECKTSKEVLSLAREILLVGKDCGSLCDIEMKAYHLPSDEYHRCTYLHKWAELLTCGIRSFLKGKEKQSTNVPGEPAQMNENTFNIYHPALGEDLFIAFQRMQEILSPLENSQEFFNLHRDFLLHDLGGQGDFSWLLKALEEEVKKNGITAMIQLWEGMYKATPPTQGLAKKIWDRIQGTTKSYYFKLIDRYMDDTVEELYINNAKITTEQAIATGIITCLDRFSLLHFIISSIVTCPLSQSAIEKDGFAAFARKAIGNRTRKDLQIIRSKEKREDDKVKSYLHNLQVVTNMYHDVYKQAIQPVKEGLSNISQIALEVFKIGKKMEAAGL